MAIFSHNITHFNDTKKNILITKILRLKVTCLFFKLKSLIFQKIMQPYFFIQLFFLSLNVNAWEIARPNIEKLNSIVFRESYVKYRIIKNNDLEKNLDNIIEINLHDQILRKGYFYQRIWNNWIGTLGTPLGTSVEENVLVRALSLVSKIPIKVNTNFYDWILKPNFSLIDSILITDTDKEAIAIAFKKEFPNIKIIRFWIGDKHLSHHPLALFKVIINTNQYEWINIFKKHNIELQLNSNLDILQD